MPVLEPCGCKFSIADRSKLHTECEMHAALRKDAERYRWLRKAGPNSMAIISYKSPSACRVEPQDYATLDEYTDAAIDAAIKDRP